MPRNGKCVSKNSKVFSSFFLLIDRLIDTPPPLPTHCYQSTLSTGETLLIVLIRIFFTMKTKKRSSSPQQVEFFPRVFYIEIPHREELTAREKRRLWFGPSGSLTNFGYRMETLALMDTGDLQEDDDDYCTRGLYTRNENRKRCNVVEAAKVAVLELQAMQMEEGYSDDEELAKTYVEMTKFSRLRALDQGRQDQLEMEELTKGLEEFWCCSSGGFDRWSSNGSEHSSRDAWGRRQHLLTEAVIESPIRDDPPSQRRF